LLTAVLDAASAMPGLTQVRLSVSVTQQEARALYAAAGFQTWGIEPRALYVDGQFVDEEHMYLPLAAHP
jgi:RimJ/RimL family protein N-acetyltransferase